MVWRSKVSRKSSICHHLYQVYALPWGLVDVMHLYAIDCKFEKLEYLSHVQKRMGTCLRNLKKLYYGKKLADGKPMAAKIINLLTQYYETPFAEIGGAMKRRDEERTLKSDKDLEEFHLRGRKKTTQKRKRFEDDLERKKIPLAAILPTVLFV
ncbi:hypothetical protein HHI36_023303 [Cryptolaemus montrouzieri]|uniref:Uncharacterized protein n=1 Tax=Cryptolaemus montrouzieri TaxID=559131 RepID=A0ABD2PG68_9CUCU